MDESEDEQSVNLTKKLQKWYKQFKPAKKCTNDLLKILNDEGFDLPRSVNNLTCTIIKQRKVVEPATAVYSDNTNENSNMDADDFQNDSMDNDVWPSAEEMLASLIVKTEICKEVDANVINDIQENQKYLNAQINYLMRQVAIVNARLADRITVDNVLEKTSYMFPIGNISELVEFEKLLENSDPEIQISNMKKVIRGDPIMKSLSKILSQNIILEHNYDGKQKKLPLNVYPKFVNALFKAYADFEDFSEFIYEFKRALKCVKNRVHKINCMNRKSLTMAAPDPLEIDEKNIKTSNLEYDDYYD